MASERASQLALRRVLGRHQDALGLVSALTAAIGTAVAIEGLDGSLLHGETPAATASRFPITHLESSLGWVAGAAEVSVVARLMDLLVDREVERKALGAEVLHLYREVNLIYGFSERLAALLDLERVAELTLEQARQMIAASDGVLMLLEESGALTAVAGFGDELPAVVGMRRSHGIIGAVVDTGIAEIVNDVMTDPRRVTAQTGMRALACAPLKVGERVIGVIALGSRESATYTAAELKLLTTLGLQAATAIENARLFERTVQAAQERERLMALHRQVEVARARLEKELELAARIQADLFPAALPPIEGYECDARNRPARQCGGDYYDALTWGTADGGQRILLCVADVSGKGLPAALVMSNTQATLRALLDRTASLPALAAQASALLYASTAPEKYVTAALVGLEPLSGALQFVGAGHLDTLILRADGHAVRLTSTGPPLGLLALDLPYGAEDLVLGRKDLLVLFSDGVTDAQNAADEEFGEARLLEVLRAAEGQPPAVIIDQVLAAIDQFADGAPQFDDITLLVLRRY